MIKKLVLLFFIMPLVWASPEKPVGFLWYNVKEKQKSTSLKKRQGIPFNQLSFTERDKVLRFYTMEALHKARHTQKVKDMWVFLSLQDYWLKESSRFKTLFEKTLLAYPELDYAVTHPTSNLGAKITDEVRQAKQIKTITSLSTSHGLLFFYRGKSLYDLKQISIIADFCRRFHLTLMPVSVDGALSKELPDSRIDQGQANRLGVRFFPALLLVNPVNQEILPVAYGLTTQDVLMARLIQVATHFKGEQE
ncbi:type-F conjugative transfer system pilin assembly protein TraF [Legionella gresilensis]|uniref:type-F conjugative transfer system pilin assembly protein TraF n=1 Tax=Legionella gresilensis TaxID=91823 RepID=UPI001041B9BE|nr:type-F conjugative transfer system pilin assembly protein TraF [Legionella gresilensis]